MAKLRLIRFPLPGKKRNNTRVAARSACENGKDGQVRLSEKTGP